MIGSDWSNIAEKKRGKVDNTVSMLLILLEIINTLLFKFWDNFSFYGKGTLDLLYYCYFMVFFFGRLKLRTLSREGLHVS